MNIGRAGRPRLLVLARYPLDRTPSQRFRFEQYLPIFEQEGWTVDVRPLMSPAAYEWFHRPGRTAAKALILLRALVRRLADVAAAPRYDTILIVRELFPAGPPFLEPILRRRARRLVFDFDDAIWLPNVSPGNPMARWLKRPGKTGTVISLCDLVIAGNRYLADYALSHNRHVVTIPTTVDTDRYVPAARAGDGPVVIGWSGSPTTRSYLDPIAGVLRRVQRDRDVRVMTIGAPDWRPDGVRIEAHPWRSETEVDLLRRFDIGLMPLTDDPWSLGKCGLKALLYMAFETPPIVSPVGVNTEIVRHEENGLHASTDGEWYEAMIRLCDDRALRRRLGESARRTVEERYSTRANAKAWLAALSA